jgi:hypothetical protein
VTSSCSAETNYQAFICSCMKPLVSSTSMITSSSTFRDYVQETYSELQCHLFPALQTFLSSRYIRTLLSENGHEFILLFIFKELYFIWELCGKLFSDSHGSCVCVGKREVLLVYNRLAVFRLSISAWNTEKQNQYQDLHILLFLVYYSSISLLWLYSLYFCKTYMYIYFFFAM